jgi:hypothetical protein
VIEVGRWRGKGEGGESQVREAVAGPKRRIRFRDGEGRGQQRRIIDASLILFHAEDTAGLGFRV